MRFLILYLSILTAVFINCEQGYDDFDKISPAERIRLREITLKFVRLNLAQRVARLNPAVRSETTITELLLTTRGVDELKALHNLSSSLIDSVTPKTFENRTVYMNYFCDQGQRYILEYTNFVKAGSVLFWPRYYYDPSEAEPIQVLPEIIKTKEKKLGITKELNDFGPSVPVFKYPSDIYEPPNDFEIKDQWIPETPEDYQNSDLHRHYYTRPRMMDYFCDLSQFIIVELFIVLNCVKEFSTERNSSLSELWPSNHDDSTEVKPTQILPEMVNDERYQEVDEFGPSVPELKDPSDIYEPLDDFEIEDQWISGTPEDYQNSDLYGLYHIIPLSLLVRFTEVFIATWRVVGNNERKMMSAPFRVLKRISESGKRSAVGFKISTKNPDELKNITLENFNFDYDIKKTLLWAPGNLFYGFEERVKPSTEFDTESEIIIGHERYRKAKMIYDNIFGFMDYLQYTGEVSEKTLRKIVWNIKEKEVLLTELTKLLMELVYFGQERTKPYPVNLSHWESNRASWTWKLKSPDRFNKKNHKNRSAETFVLSLYDSVCHNFR